MDPTDSQAAPTSFGTFDGPLDFLLEEVRRHNVAIENVPLAPITNRFLEYLRSASERNLNLDIEWVLMAATLIQWKSQAILPANEESGDVARIPDSLRIKLLDHAKQIADDLERRQLREANCFERPNAPSEQVATGGAAPPETTVWDLIQQAREIQNWVAQHRRDVHGARAIVLHSEEVTIAEMTDYLRDRINRDGVTSLDAKALLLEQASGARRSSLFLAMLEMAQTGHLNIVQRNCFGPISLLPLAETAGN